MHRTIRTGFTMGLGTVFHRTTCKVVALDRTSEAFTAGNADSIHQITGCENISRNLVANFIIRGFGETQLTHVFHRRYAGFVEEALHGFVYLFFFLRFLSSKGVMLFAQIAIVEALCRSAEADGCKSPKAPDNRSTELNSSINL